MVIVKRDENLIYAIVESEAELEQVRQEVKLLLNRLAKERWDSKVCEPIEVVWQYAY